MANSMECPIDFKMVNENKVRMIALLVCMLSVLFLFVGHWAIPLFLLIDFYFRGFHNGQYSLLGWISDVLVKACAIGYKPIDRAPKRFAAQIGFLVCDMLFIMSILELKDASFYTGFILVLFSFLESFLGICVGCYAYNFLKLLKKQQNV